MTTVLFDLDGTLTDSGVAIANSYAAVCDTLGLPRPSTEVIRSFIGPPLEVTWRTLAPDAATATRGVLLYREHYTVHGAAATAVYPGVREMLAALAAADVHMAVATSKDEHIATLVLDHLGLTRYFGTVSGAARDGTRHHKIDVISEALDRLGRPTGRVAMVGDRDHDILGARHHGLDAVGVLWGFGDRRELEGAGATWLLDAPGQLPAILDIV